MPAGKSPHPASIDPTRLLKECEVGFGRSTGPGGQHRNRRDTAVTITHLPTGTSAAASERRDQRANRLMALRRLRIRLAIEVRSTRPGGPSPLWKARRSGTKMSVNPRNPDYPALLAEGLDAIDDAGYDVASAAGILGITMSQLTRLVRHEKAAFTLVNRGREEHGFPPLRQ